MVISTIFAITYGKTLNMNHEYVVTAQMAVEGLEIASRPGAFWVKLFPFLRHIPSWVPGTGAKRLADKFAPYITTAKDKPFKEVQMAVVCILLLLS